mmetsp:Transcript_36661/g.92182  ORF Transcript_36661/g.92182 Transcript_36661/m.92182 type:complete len:82 (+) Transcript_36661:303-548(+)
MMSTILSLKIFEKRFTEAFSAPSMSSQCTQPLKGGLTRASSVWMKLGRFISGRMRCKNQSSRAWLLFSQITYLSGFAHVGH